MSLKIFLIILGAFLFISGVRGWAKQASIHKNGIRKTGIIIKYEWYGPPFKKSLWPIIQFDFDGQTLELKPETISINYCKDVGSQIKIIYWNKYPETVALQDQYYWLMYLPIMLLGILTPLIGQFIYLSRP